MQFFKKEKQLLFLLISIFCFGLMIWINRLIKIDTKNKIKIEIKLSEFEKHKLCYMRDISDDKIVEYFPKLLTSFIQPKPNEAIFFIDSNCVRNGLLSITPR